MTRDDAKKDRSLPEGITALLTARQAAEYASLSIPTIYKYCRPNASPQIPNYGTPDGGIRIDLDDLKRWLKRRSARAANESRNRGHRRKADNEPGNKVCAPAPSSVFQRCVRCLTRNRCQTTSA